MFLDRDGVLNRSVVRNGKPYPPASLADLEIIAGVPEALMALRGAGFKALVVTNQPDVATGKTTRQSVDAIHAHMRATLAIDAIYACFCVEGPDCPCYKPRPDMLIDAAREWHVDLAQSYMVGDRWRDVGAGRAAGCCTLFIDYGYAERRPEAPDHVVEDLAHAARIILGHGRGDAPV